MVPVNLLDVATVRRAVLQAPPTLLSTKRPRSPGATDAHVTNAAMAHAVFLSRYSQRSVVSAAGRSQVWPLHDVVACGGRLAGGVAGAP
jgi:hypothetical protein